MLKEIKLPAIISSNRAVEIDLVQGIVRGYVFIWGDPTTRDSYETWFDPAHPGELALDFAPWPLHYEHTQDGVIRKDIIGKIYKTWFDDIGCRFEANLYRDKPYFPKLCEDIRKKKLKTSSATSPHLAEFDADGRFVHWELSEVSLTEYPSESRMPAVEIIRSAEQGRDATGADNTLNPFPLSENTQLEGNIMPPLSPQIADAGAPPAPAQRDAASVIQAAMEQGYSLDEIAAALQTLMGAGTGEARTDALPVQPTPAPAPDTTQRSTQPLTVESLMGVLNQQRSKTQAQQLIEARAEIARLQAARNAPPPQQPRPTHTPQISNMRDLRYAHMSASDMAFVHQTLRGKGGTSPELMRAMAFKTVQAAEKGDKVAGDYAVRASFPLKYMRSDEIMASDIAAQGDEWVGVFYSTSLWDKVRVARVYEQFLSRGMMEIEVPQGAESVKVPTEGSDPTWYTTIQADDLDATSRPEVTVKSSVVGTGQVTATPGELSAAVFWNQILEEDSLIAVAPQVSRQMQESAAETIEYVILNADSDPTANTNINLIDGTPGTGLSTPKYLVTDGMLKLPLITNTSNSRDGGALTEDDYLETVKLLSDELAADFTKLLFVTDVRTNIASKSMAVVKTRDVNSAATIENGNLASIWGIDIAVSGQMGLAYTAGKISTTGSNNTKGRILCVVPQYWALVWKRHIEVKTAEDVLGNVKYLVARMRLAVKYRSTEASALSYNLTV